MRAELAHLVFEQPDDLAHFAADVTAYLGPAGGEGADLFEFRVCTPGWLAEHPNMPKGSAFLRHHLLVERWDAALVERAIRDLCLRTEGGDWQEVATKLSRYGYWEFEDYRE